MHSIHQATYVVFAFLLSVVLLLLFDRKIYETEGMKTETVFSKWAGWVNLSVMALLFASLAIYFFVLL